MQQTKQQSVTLFDAVIMTVREKFGECLVMMHHEIGSGWAMHAALPSTELYCTPQHQHRFCSMLPCIISQAQRLDLDLLLCHSGEHCQR